MNFGNMFRIANWSLATKLAAVTVAVSGLAVTSLGSMAFSKSREAMRTKVEQTLTGLVAERGDRIESYFEMIEGQASTFAQSETIGRATAAFVDAFATLPEQVVADEAAVTASLNDYFTREFRPRLDEAGKPDRKSVV